MDTSSTTIIVAIDDSSASRRAIDVALAFADQGETLNFVHAVDSASVLVPLADGALIDTAPVIDSLSKDARALCNAAVDRARACGCKATSTLLDGTAAEAIVRFVADSAAGMIIIGTHARTGFSRLVHGSIAETILRRTAVPVVITHADDFKRNGAILVAVDDSEPARAAFRFALGRALHSGSMLRLLYVRTANETPAIPVFVSLLCRDARDAGVQLETSIRGGEIAEAIVSETDSRDCSMIVIGTHARNALQRIVQHEVVNRVVETAKVPVTVVHLLHDRSQVGATAMS